jgi:hypothetical protein
MLGKQAIDYDCDQTGQMQVDYHLLRTDEPVDRALGLYLTKRQHRK